MKKNLFFAITLLFLSCNVESDLSFVQTLIIASETRQCTGIDVQECLLVKESDSQTTWQNFHDPILGFTHEAGFEYVIRVNREFISANANVSDSSVYQYTLLEILSREEKDSEGL